MAWRNEAARGFNSKTPRAQRLQRRPAQVLPLERRLLMCSGAADPDDAISLLPHDAPAYEPVHATSTTSLDGASGDAGAEGYTATGVPILNSNPAARAQLYLDFDGDPATTWGSFSVPATPAFDQDGDTSNFSAGELASMREIWERVAEKYAPFNLNVTTVNPGTLAERVSLRVVIGGNGSWRGGGSGGVAYVGGFYNSAPNTVYVSEDNLGNGHPVYTAAGAAHESGHGFGLEHQSVYNADGSFAAEYNYGTNATAPVMGVSYYSERGLWWNGPTLSATTRQDDMAVIAGANSAFGYRTDDHGGTTATGTPLSLSGSSASASGIIERVTDADYFSFSTDGGTVSFALSVARFGPTLDAKLVLMMADGSVIAASDTAALGESLSAFLPAGSYRLAVASHGGYGDVGQYTLTGTVVPSTNPVAAPSNFAAAGRGGEIDLTWKDNSANETGFVVERSSDAGVTWANIVVAGVDAQRYVDAGAAPGVTYHYRVYALTDTAGSDTSNVAIAAVAPLAPTGLLAMTAASTGVDLRWDASPTSTGYVLERSLDGGTAWSTLAILSGGATTSFQDGGLVAGTSYHYRVLATNSAGTSPASNTVLATTLSSSSSGVPSAPGGLSARSVNNKKIRLAWADNSHNESAFVVERSANGGAWVQIATVGANVTSYDNGGLQRGATYAYRVYATNVAGASDSSNVATVVVAAPSLEAPSSDDASQGVDRPGEAPVSDAPLGLSLVWTRRGSTLFDEVAEMLDGSAVEGRG